MKYMTIPSLNSLTLAFAIACAIVAIGIIVSRRKNFLTDFS